MTKTEDYKTGVMAIVSLARKENSRIGNYQEHYINDNFGFTIKLNNGSIKMSREIAQDYESQPSSITDDRIVAVSRTFIQA